MNIEVLFTKGTNTIHLRRVLVSGDEAARIPLENKGKMYEVLIWQLEAINQLTILLLPRFPRQTWRWSGTIARGRRWQKLTASDASVLPPWACKIRRVSQ